jgi:hypothetical protein
LLLALTRGLVFVGLLRHRADPANHLSDRAKRATRFYARGDQIVRYPAPRKAVDGLVGAHELHLGALGFEQRQFLGTGHEQPRKGDRVWPAERGQPASIAYGEGPQASEQPGTGTQARAVGELFTRNGRQVMRFIKDKQSIARIN